MRRLVTLAIAALLVVATVPAAQAKAGKEDWRESGTVVRVLDGDTFDMDTAAGKGPGPRQRDPGAGVHVVRRPRGSQRPGGAAA